MQLCDELSSTFATQLLQFSQLCNSITTIFPTFQLNYYNFLNFATQLLQFSTQLLQFSHISTCSSTRAVCQQNTGLHKPGERNSNSIVHTYPSEHLSEFREFFAMAFPAFRPTKLTFFKRKCSVRQALLHGRQHGRRVHGPVLRLEATLRVCCRRHHNNLS